MARAAASTVGGSTLAAQLLLLGALLALSRTETTPTPSSDLRTMDFNNVTMTEYRSNDTIENEKGDAIFDGIMNDVFKDEPQRRDGSNQNVWKLTGRVSSPWSSIKIGSSFGVGVREFFGSGGSIIMKTTLNGQSLNQYNGLYPGFGSNGNWIMQPSLNVNKTKLHRTETVDVTKLMTQLRASVFLRDNMVTVFGYILNVPKNPLSTELYTSLYHIYDAVRLRRIPTFDLIRVVNDLAGMKPNDQFLTLFRAMSGIVPRYLQSAVSIWIDECLKDSSLLDDILRPGGGPLIVDFLAGIERSVIKLLSEELKWNRDPNNCLPCVKEFYGASVFEDIFIALKEGSLELTQPLFAIILVNRPMNDVAGEQDETERYLVDVLRLENVDPWIPITQKVTPEEKSDPDKLIKKVLQLISESKTIDPQIRKESRYLKPYINKPNATYSNKHYEILSGVMSKPSIDILTLLKSIAPNEYPNYVVKANKRLVDYILDGQLNIEFVTKGFNRFDHVTPMNVLIALLTRINKRLPHLPKPVIQAVKTLQLFLLYKKNLCEMSSNIPISLVDVSAILNAYDDPSVPSNVTKLVTDLSNRLPEEHVPWDDVAKHLSQNQCVLPRQCIRNFLNLLVHKKYLPKGHSSDIIKKLLKLIDESGNPKLRRPLPGQLVHLNTSVLATSTPISTSIDTDYTVSLVENIDYIKSSDWRHHLDSSNQSYLLEVERIAKIGRTLPFPPLSVIQQEEPALVKYPATCLPPTVSGTSENIKMLPAHLLLSWDRLPEFVSYDFQQESNIKKGELLQKLMEQLRDNQKIQKFEEVNHYIQSFLQFLYTFKKTSSAESVVHFPSLLNALPLAKSDIEEQYFTKLKHYFSEAEFYKTLGIQFNPRQYKTRGKMLKYVLTVMSPSPVVEWDPILKKAIEYYMDKVYTNGYGAQEVDWTLLSEVSEPTYVNMTVFKALDHSNMTEDALQAEYELIRFIARELIPNVHLKDFNMGNLKTKGRFLKGTFEHLLSQDSVSPRIKKNIQLVMRYIRTDDRGAEPLDYNANLMRRNQTTL